jgi:phage-related minor tail protein
VVFLAFSSMLPSILTVVKGVGGLLVDGLIAAGNATQGFIAGIFGMTGAMDKFYMKLSENGPSKFGGMIQAASSIMTGVFAVGVGVAIAGLAMMAAGAYDSMIAVSDLNKAMVLGGNAFNMTGAQALAYADTLSSANVSTLGIIEVMTEMSKVGGFTADQIALVSKAAFANGT